MKKALLATSAIVAAGIASSASAAEWTSGVNGYWFVGVAAMDSERAIADGVGVLRDGEIHFNASLKADNGITFKSRVELESFTTGDQIDENYATISGSFGSVQIGSNDDQAYNNNVGIIYAPGARIGYYDAFSNSGVFVGPSNFGDQIGIHYTTPSFSGFSAGASYIPNTATDAGGDTNNPVFEVQNAWAVGANYSGDFDGFGVGLSGGYADASGPNNDSWQVGANVSASGFKVAATYNDAVGQNNYGVGAQYNNGPMTIGAGYANDTAGQAVASGWLTYAIAPGVSGTVGLEYSEDAADAESISGLAYLALSF